MLGAHHFHELVFGLCNSLSVVAVHNEDEALKKSSKIQVIHPIYITR